MKTPFLDAETPAMRARLLALDPSDLSDVVDEMKANEASVVNRSGEKAQLEYLLSELTATDILEWLGVE